MKYNADGENFCSTLAIIIYIIAFLAAALTLFFVSFKVCLIIAAIGFVVGCHFMALSFICRHLGRIPQIKEEDK